MRFPKTSTCFIRGTLLRIIDGGFVAKELATCVVRQCVLCLAALHDVLQFLTRCISLPTTCIHHVRQLSTGLSFAFFRNDAWFV